MAMRRFFQAAATLAVLVFAPGCHPQPVIGGTSQHVGGTIAGVVTASRNTAPLSGRKVTATNVTTSSRYETTTAVNGGYTMRVPEGTYRLDVELRPGETFEKRPAATHVGNSDVDAGRDFVITVKP